VENCQDVEGCIGGHHTLVLRMYNIYKPIYTNSLNNVMDNYEYLFVKS
jgi:hypothetical protein